MQAETDNPSDITGMGFLIDTSDAKSGFNILELEKSIASGNVDTRRGYIPKQEKTETFEDMLKSLEEPVGGLSGTSNAPWRFDVGAPETKAVKFADPIYNHSATQSAVQPPQWQPQSQLQQLQQPQQQKSQYGQYAAQPQYQSQQQQPRDPFELSDDNFLTGSSTTNDLDSLLDGLGLDEPAKHTGAPSHYNTYGGGYNGGGYSSSGYGGSGGGLSGLGGSASSFGGASGFGAPAPVFNNDPFQTQNRFTSDSYKSDRQLMSLTQEEERRKIIDQALLGVSSNVDTSKARDDDEKSIALENIASILQILQDEGEDVSKIIPLTMNDPLPAIREQLKIVDRRLNRRRAASFGEDLFMLGAHFIEWVFDGKRSYFGWTPDMTDWHKTVQGKLRRNRNDTSSMIDGMIREHGLGYGSRILLDLVPSGILYSRMKKTQGGSDNIVTDDEFNAGVSKLRDHL